MSLLTSILVVLVALEFFYIMYLETFATQSDSTSRTFSMEKEELKRESVMNLFKNQGVYNGLIGVFLLYALFWGHAKVELISVLLIYIILVALYGAWTVDRKILIKQAGLAILALLSLLF